MRIIFSIIFLFIITSCTSVYTSKKSLIGKYKTKNSNAMELTLSDTTFSYTNISSLYKAKSKGTWELKGKDIVLTSFPEFKNNIIEVEEIEPQEKRQVHVYDEDGLSYKGVAVIYINKGGNKTFKETDKNGVIVLPKDLHIDSFTIGYLGEEHSYKVKKELSGYKVKLYFDDLNREYFDHEVIKVKNKRLIYDSIYKLYCFKILDGASDAPR